MPRYQSYSVLNSLVFGTLDVLLLFLGITDNFIRADQQRWSFMCHPETLISTYHWHVALC